MADRRETTPFDESAALAELERFRTEIERYRARRRAVGDEFEQFVSSARQPSAAGTGSAAVAPRSADPATVRLPPPPAPRPAPAIADDLTLPARAPAGLPRTPAPERPAASTRPAPKAAPVPNVEPRMDRTADRPPVRRPLLLVGAVVLIVLAVVAVWTSRLNAPAPSNAPGSASSTPATPAQPTIQTPPPEPAPPTAAPAGSATEITTSRRVWVRVIADGERVLERLLGPEERVPVRAEKTIVIRTGDAGAIRLTIAGQDQGALGRDGEVVTRTFNVPGPQNRRP